MTKERLFRINQQRLPHPFAANILRSGHAPKLPRSPPLPLIQVKSRTRDVPSLHKPPKMKACLGIIARENGRLTRQSRTQDTMAQVHDLIKRGESNDDLLRVVFLLAHRQS